MTVEATSITAFCEAHSLSRATFYNLKKRGMAPRTMAVGRRRLVSAESAAAWRLQMEERTSDTPTGKE